MPNRTIEESLIYEQCRRDAHTFIFGTRVKKGRRTYLVTKDEHNTEQPVSPFPDLLYLRALVDLFLVSGGFIKPKEAIYADKLAISEKALIHLGDTNMLAVEKSRQLMATWICLAYTLWRAIFHKHQLCIVQSKREEDVKKLVCTARDEPDNARLTFMISNLPNFLKPEANCSKNNIYFSELGSSIWGIPQGGDIIRSNTPSLFFSDEAAFQPAFDEAYGAALPAVRGGGQAFFVSSAEVGSFQEIVEADDREIRIGNDQKFEDTPPFSARITSDDLFVVRLHYTADPGKSPDTSAGREWLRREIMGYPGGVQGPKWQKEMEIVYAAGSGEKAFPDWALWQRDSNIFIPEPDGLPDECTVWGSFDHGYVNPACYLVHILLPNGLRQTVWEFYADHVDVPQICEIILGNDVTLKDGRFFPGNPYAGLERLKICDPSIDMRNQSQSDGETKKLIELYQERGVYFTKSEKGDDSTVVEWLKGTLWADPQNPSYQISMNCPNLIWELGQLTRMSATASQLRFKNKDERFVNKDNHAFDALKYFMKRFPVGAPKKEVTPAPPANSFKWWLDQKSSKNKRRSFRRRPVGLQKPMLGKDDG